MFHSRLAGVVLLLSAALGAPPPPDISKRADPVAADVAVILNDAFDANERMKAVERIRDRAPEEVRAAVDALVAALPAAGRRTWLEAVSALGLIGAPAEPAVPALLAVLG